MYNLAFELGYRVVTSMNAFCGGEGLKEMLVIFGGKLTKTLVVVQARVSGVSHEERPCPGEEGEGGGGLHPHLTANSWRGNVRWSLVDQSTGLGISQ